MEGSAKSGRGRGGRSGKRRLHEIVLLAKYARSTYSNISNVHTHYFAHIQERDNCLIITTCNKILYEMSFLRWLNREISWCEFIFILIVVKGPDVRSPLALNAKCQLNTGICPHHDSVPLARGFYYYCCVCRVALIYHHKSVCSLNSN